MVRVTDFSSGFNDGFGSANARSYLQIVTPVSAGSYDDGDILSAVTYRHVRAERAEGVCARKVKANGVRNFERLNADGLFDPGDVLEDWFEATSEFKFERLNKTEGRITRLSDMNEITFTTKQPFVQHDGKTVQMDMDSFLARRKRSLAGPGGRGKPIFGTPGNEYWYGGRSSREHANLDVAWLAIENKLQISEAEVADKAVFSDYRKRLVIAVNDMSDESAGLLTKGKTDIEDATVNTVVADGDDWTVTLSSSASALASASGAKLVIEGKEHPILSVNGSQLSVISVSAPATGIATIQAETAKRGNTIQWRGLRDVIEPDVLDRRIEVRIDTIRKHVTQEIVEAKQ
jgi:hypothetical protein